MVLNTGNLFASVLCKDFIPSLYEGRQKIVVRTGNDFVKKMQQQGMLVKVI